MGGEGEEKRRPKGKAGEENILLTWPNGGAYDKISSIG